MLKKKKRWGCKSHRFLYYLSIPLCLALALVLFSNFSVASAISFSSIPVLPLKADKDKYTRVQGVLEYIASGLVHLPHNEQYGFNPEILNEVESFTGNNTHLHDDVTDTLVYLIMVTIARRQVSILEVS